MSKTKAMIVDDSNFSIKVTRGMLERNNIEVVSVATTVSEAIENFKKLSDEIDLVTMDITLPDGDGLDCAKTIVGIKRSVNVLIMSSMLDDEIVKKAKDIGARSCLQKPIDEEELSSKLSRLFETEKLFYEIEDSYEAAFIESAVSNLTRATKSNVSYKICDFENNVFESRGISVALGLIGAHRGRVIFDISKETAKELTKSVYATDDVSMEDISEYIVELTNIICGNSASLLNGINRSFGLRVSPPTTFYGDDLEVVIGDIKGSVIRFYTKFGEIFLSVAFQRGIIEWM